MIALIADIKSNSSRTLRFVSPLLSIVILLAFISGCVSLPKTELAENNQQQRKQLLEAIESWTLTGRLGIKSPDQANSLSFKWQHDANQKLLLFYGTFGNTYARLSQSKNQATLELSDDRVYQSDNVEEMLQLVLGYPLPVDHLDYWVRGLAFPGEKSELTYDALGYLNKIIYKQWTITFKNYQHFKTFDDISLPGKIKVTNGEVTLRLSLRKWQLGTDL
ncbi:MAG: outer membrane lipoprotein LolB [Enterobacterales bacterium]|jgi:outer membrane lipoprotein LolB